MTSPSSVSSSRSPKLLDQLRERIRVKHYRIRTEQQWVKRYPFFQGMRHPEKMGKSEGAVCGYSSDRMAEIHAARLLRAVCPSTWSPSRDCRQYPANIRA
jgi:hypothetical protein